MSRDFGSNFDQIPPHGRWRHFDIGRPRVEPLLSQWQSQSLADSKEASKRLIDLFVVSVLLDAGAGKDWGYTEDGGARFTRSEGLAVASIHMFEAGLFSSDKNQPHRVDAAALSKISVDSIAKHMQVSESNPLVGLEGRTSLLKNLSNALLDNPKFFGEVGRPGNMLGFLESASKSSSDGKTRQVPLAALWQILIEGLSRVWPATRTKLAGIALGDVWPCEALKESAKEESDDLVPFHKLTQWMTYSVVEAIKQTMKWEIVGMEDMTGLPEYRNGGLFMDLGVLSLKPDALPTDPQSGLPKAASDHPAIVEWRAMTVILLDRVADSIRTKAGLSPAQLNLAQVLESATWKGGREIAKTKRPETGGPPLELESDGTVF
ncbi:hypothetical protein D9758_011926 [Tetrapyrgos nigripes]|uniref:DUF1688-domain-containing protein n=1 Tax=Tetrapyrgos nigripes TaxID=182062 RepID=A0A8H5D415_9AGAR|nr:hypothetical protein D9758_011926 [Tetrapyrgos nigripes]